MPIPKPILRQRDYILDHVERIASPLWDGDVDGHPDFPTVAGLNLQGQQFLLKVRLLNDLYGTS
jgi:hypothetical protein